MKHKFKQVKGIKPLHMKPCIIQKTNSPAWVSYGQTDIKEQLDSHQGNWFSIKSQVVVWQGIDCCCDSTDMQAATITCITQGTITPHHGITRTRLM